MISSTTDVSRKLLDVTQTFESPSALLQHIELLEAMGFPGSWATLFLQHYNKRNAMAARQAEIDRTGIDPLDLGRQFTGRTDLTAYLLQLKEWGYTKDEIFDYAIEQAKTWLFTDRRPDSQSPASP